MGIKDILRTSSYFILNKNLLKTIGIEETVLLTCLCEAEEFFNNEGEWFYQTVATIEEMTGLSEFKQNKIVNNLLKFGIVEKKLAGLPAKRYFRINEERILHFCRFHKNNNLGASTEEIKELILNNSGTATEETSDNKEYIYKENNINKKDINNNTKDTKSLVEPSDKSSGSNRNNTNTILGKKNKKEKENSPLTPQKKKHYEILVEKIHEMFEGEEEIIKQLELFLGVRIKKGLTAPQWESILNNVLEIPRGKRLVAVKNSVQCGYMTVYTPNGANKKVVVDDIKKTKKKISKEEDEIDYDTVY